MTAGELSALLARLSGTGAAALAAVGDRELLSAWDEVVAVFRDPDSVERRRLAPALGELTGLSPAGLAAGLDVVLGGVGPGPARELVRAAAGRRQPAPALAVLAGNLPALAVQPLLAALVLRRPLLLKSPSGEPLFAPAFVAALGRRLPALASGVAAVSWRGGDAEVEAPLLAAVPRVLAYGDAAALADLRRRARGTVVDYGPKLSLAVVSAGVDVATGAAGLARDVALFDQRGCLSVQAVFVAGEALAAELAHALAAALAAVAEELPPGTAPPEAAGAVQQLRAEAAMRGLTVPSLPLDSGTVIVEPRPELLPSPGLRTVRVHPLAGVDALLARLDPWRDRLQGAALAGDAAVALAPRLLACGVSRWAAPGELQSATASWHNGGRDPLEVLAEA